MYCIQVYASEIRSVKPRDTYRVFYPNEVTRPRGYCDGWDIEVISILIGRQNSL